MKRKVLWLILFSPFYLSSKELPTIAVLDFPVAKNAILLGEGFPQDTWHNRHDLLVHDMIRVLKRSRKFTVVDRSHNRSLEQEKELLRRNNYGSVDYQKLGRLLAARYLVFGTIESVEASLERRRVPNSKRHYYTRSMGRIRVHMRITDSNSGKVVAAETVETEHENNDVLAMKFIENLKQEAIIKMVNRVIDTVYPMRISEVDTTTREIFINRGLDGSLKLGDEIEILQEGKEIVDPETGQVLGSRTYVLCRVRLTAIEDHFSIAALDSRCPNLAIGTLCKLK